jgi:hypothetical protein
MGYNLVANGTSGSKNLFHGNTFRHHFIWLRRGLANRAQYAFCQFWSGVSGSSRIWLSAAAPTRTGAPS